VSQTFLDAVRNPPAIAVRLEVWRSGARVDPYGEQGLAVYAGQVQLDRTKLVRRTLSGVHVDATDDTWNLLSPPGTELRAFRGFRYPNGSSELIPVGRFLLDDLSETYGGEWDGAVDTAPDVMVRVQRAQFLTPRTFLAGTRISDVISTLVGEILGPVTNLASSQATLLTDAVFDTDRGKAVTDSATSIGADVFCAPDGSPVIVDTPQLADPVWAVDTGDSGILYKASRQRRGSESYSAVAAVSQDVGGAPPWPPQVAYDDDPNSPTYYLGPFGLVPLFLPSALYGAPDQALAAARARLPLVSGAHAQLDIDAECNPALDGGDTIEVRLPRRLRGQTPVTEQHLVSALTVPLTAAGTQSITSFSTAADLLGGP
jgi:hypothetical protein